MALYRLLLQGSRYGLSDHCLLGGCKEEDRMKTALCGNCGEAAKVVRGNYRLEEFGLPVELMRIELIKCSKCGEVDPIIPNIDGLMTAVALRVICSTSLLDGEE